MLWMASKSILPHVGEGPLRRIPSTRNWRGEICSRVVSLERLLSKSEISGLLARRCLLTAVATRCASPRGPPSLFPERPRRPALPRYVGSP